VLLQKDLLDGMSRHDLANLFEAARSFVVQVWDAGEKPGNSLHCNLIKVFIEFEPIL
jgi:hypothetical protein